MGKSLRGDPTAVIAELSGWLSNPDSPAIWAPFAFSIRGLAYEVMDECELARMDYMQGLNLYDTLMEELGEEVLQRMTNNMKFMRVRLEALPPAAVSPVESYFEKYGAEAVDHSDIRESTPIHNDVSGLSAEEHVAEEESTYQWEQHEGEQPEGEQHEEEQNEEEQLEEEQQEEEQQEEEQHEDEPHEKSDETETLNQQEQVWDNWEDDVNTETAAVDVANEPGAEGQSGEDNADHAEEEHEEENVAVNGEIAIQITDVQNSGETPFGNVDDGAEVLDFLNSGTEFVEVKMDGAQANLLDLDDEATGEQQGGEADPKTGVDPEAEPQHQTTD